MTVTHSFEMKPNPVQRSFIESKAKADLFSSRMGEGKSTALVWASFYHTRHNPGAQWALIRDTYENMQATTQKEFFKWFQPGVFGTYNASKRVFTWAEGVAKGEVTFLGMDDPQDAAKLMSRELAGFGMDEPAPAVGSAGINELIFDIAMSRLRQPDMNWYCGKLAENNPDETHWTYRRFVSPGTEGFMTWQPPTPENALHLPDSYYAELRKLWAHRPDLIRRFVEGEFGFQSEGKSVTPEWNDALHLAIGLNPMPRQEVICMWDFGLNATCLLCQVSPMGQLNVLDALSEEECGTEELIVQGVRPLLRARYMDGGRSKITLRHMGDPNGKMREQSSAKRSAVRTLLAELGGTWRSGPVEFEERREPLRALLTKTHGGKGLIRVDRQRAAIVWHALRGGWHFKVSRSGIISGEPQKNQHSHPGDALGYGVALLFPLGRLQKRLQGGSMPIQQASYFGRGGADGPKPLPPPKF